MPNAMDRGHAAGHQGGTVWHAHRRGDIVTIEANALGSDRIQGRGSERPVAIATEMVCPLLVRNDEKEIGRARHFDFNQS
jgi:hypothetical protein